MNLIRNIVTHYLHELNLPSVSERLTAWWPGLAAWLPACLCDIELMIVRELLLLLIQFLCDDFLCSSLRKYSTGNGTLSLISSSLSSPPDSDTDSSTSPCPPQTLVRKVKLTRKSILNHARCHRSVKSSDRGGSICTQAITT